ncbi:MAG: acetylornithine aminotransferase [Gammaproteobacteria bacterium RBG_16_57_12]|nr:MAG: acetylornithine aminotransferase [Gammaproteobacteria bacterium RBG_16_57_12]
MSNALMSTYSPLPVSFEKGAGAWLWDTQGNKYLDAISGIAVCGLGHAHPAVTEALCQQAGKLLHTSNLYTIANQQRLAQSLTRLAQMDKVFFCNSGAEANEAAIKLARLYGHHKDLKTPTIVVTQNSFHGRTLATLTATGNRKVQAGFEPLVQGFLRVEYNDITALQGIAETNKEVVAILVEPIQGEGGINIPDDDYLQQIRSLCDRHGWLMMLDEIQTGMCRTGQWFAFQHTDIVPDVITLAKGLGNGMPIGACLARGAAAEVFAPGNHGSTFGGNPLACSAALAVIATLENQQLAARAAELGRNMLTQLHQQLAGVPHVVAIRGRGLMIGIELSAPCRPLVQQALAAGLLINVTSDKVIRLLPPLILSNDEAAQIVATVARLVREFTPEAS